jgi:hypothetical protein
MDRLRKMSRTEFPVLRHRPLITSLEGFAKALRAVKTKAAAAYAACPGLSPDYLFFNEHGDGVLFIEYIDRYRKAIEGLCEEYRDCSPQKGHRLRDPCADAAVRQARDLIDRNCPWRRKPTLTAKGPWLRLASLVYEANTGEYDRNLLRYCRRLAKADPVKT